MVKGISAMACELLTSCSFFVDHMKELPKTSDYIQKKLCFDDYTSCNRYKIYQQFGDGIIPFNLDPADTEAVKKIIQSPREKQNHEP